MWLYILLLKIASLFNRKARLLVEGEKKSLDYLQQQIDNDCDYVWFHAASVGEFEQARPIIERLRADMQSSGRNEKILLTFFSPSGYEMRKNYRGADIVAYLPFATRHNAKRFLDIVNPRKAIFVKYEFWPAYLKQLKKRDIPTFIISAIFQPNQLFFRWYGGWYRKLLKCFTTLFVQDEDSRLLLDRYGISNVIVAGDTRFDRVAQIARGNGGNSVLETFVRQNDSKPVLIAGSTWQPDDDLLAKYFRQHADMRLIIVPHELDKAHLDRLKQQFGDDAIFYTRTKATDVSRYRCLVVDTMGLLSSAYRYGQVAYVGGGFGVGIHNTLEAAVYALPVVFGPNYKKFREARDLIKCGGGFSVSDYDSFEQQMNQLLANPHEAGEKAGSYVASNCGATDKILLQLTSDSKAV